MRRMAVMRRARRARPLPGRYLAWVWWHGPPVARPVDGEVEVTEGDQYLVPTTWAKRFGWTWGRRTVTAPGAMTDEQFEAFLSETWGGNRDGR